MRRNPPRHHVNRSTKQALACLMRKEPLPDFDAWQAECRRCWGHDANYHSIRVGYAVADREGKGNRLVNIRLAENLSDKLLSDIVALADELDEKEAAVEETVEEVLWEEVPSPSEVEPPLEEERVDDVEPPSPSEIAFSMLEQAAGLIAKKELYEAAEGRVAELERANEAFASQVKQLEARLHEKIGQVKEAEVRAESLALELRGLRGERDHLAKEVLQLKQTLRDYTIGEETAKAIQTTVNLLR